MEQTGKDLNEARKVYFDLIKMQKMARMKHSVTKRVVREGKRPLTVQKERQRKICQPQKRGRGGSDQEQKLYTR